MEISSVDLTKQGLAEIPYKSIDIDTNWLILSDNKIRSVDGRIKSLRHLTRLALNDNRITEVSKDIGRCQMINWVDLTRNKLKFLPEEFGILTKITGLGLSENEFEEIPNSIYKLKNLRKFGFFSNKITRISSDIKFLKNLIKIDLSNNRIKEIPEELCTLTNLSWLNLSNNCIKTLPRSINALVKLEELGLGMNEIEEVPDMSKLTSLKILPLFKNKISKVHPGLFTLKSIEKLDFSDNLLAEFPVDAIYCPSLKYLNLRNNQIEYIPANKFLETLSSVGMIDLSDNLLRFIPFKLFKSFSESTTIRLSNNPYEKDPAKIPSENSLLQICFTKILRKNYKIEPWQNAMFSHQNRCDYCRKMFVVEPYFVYQNSFFDAENQFVVEKMLCSAHCLRKTNE